MTTGIASGGELAVELKGNTKRVLFVDDEERLMGGFRNQLRSFRDIDFVFASGSEAALEQLRSAPFDVVVSGMGVRGGHRAALLQRVKDEHPGVARVVMAGNADQDAIFTALPVSHQFVSNPDDIGNLLNVIDRACRLRTLLSDESLRKSIGNIDKLPSLPTLYHEMMNAMARPDVSPKLIAGIIEQDPAMTAKILQLVNSASFATARHIGRIDHAVVYLGTDLIKNLTLTAHVFGSLSKHLRKAPISLEQEQQHAVTVAKVASRLLKKPQDSQHAFTAGLLHDIGNLILAMSLPESFAAMIEASKTSNRPRYQLEFEMMGVTHAQAGAYLLGLWGLPYPIVEAVAFHHSPDAASERVFDVPTATSLADKLVDREMGIPVDIDVDHLERLDVARNIPLWTTIAQEEVQRRHNRN